MKIVYVSGSIIPSHTANSIHVMKMCQALAKNGHDVLLLSYKKKGTNISGQLNLYEFYGVEKCFKISRKPWLPIPGRGQLYGCLTALQAKANSPHLVYGRKLESCFFSALLGLPVIYEVHQPVKKYDKISEKYFRLLIKNKSFKGLVVISHALKKYYQQHYPLTDDKYIVAPDAADIPSSSVKLNLESSNKMQVGYIGHLYPGKGMELISELVSRCPWAVFHIVGGTKEDLDKWKAILHKYSNIKFHGFIPHGQLGKYLHSFDVLIAPYQKDVLGDGNENIGKWMSPLKIFEYMAAGKPIVCSDLPVLREILEHQVNALLCDAENIESWVEALRLLKDNDKLRSKLGSSAQKRFVESYTWETRAKKVVSNLRQAF